MANSEELAQPFTAEDLAWGERIVQSLHGLQGYSAWAEYLAKERAARPSPAVPEEAVERACVAWLWVYGTELERRYSQREPDDGQTPETLWASSTEEEREFARVPMRAALRAALLPAPHSDVREECARIVAGEVYETKYRTWPAIPGYQGNRSADSEIVRHCDALVAAIRKGSAP